MLLLLRGVLRYFKQSFQHIMSQIQELYSLAKIEVDFFVFANGVDQLAYLL